jgi:hypothetical protein
MESLKNFVRYSWNSSPKVRTNVVNDLIESLKNNQTDGKWKNQWDLIDYLNEFQKICRILL